MKMSLSSLGLFEKELQKIRRELDDTSDIEPAVARGVEQLRIATPINSGETAESWGSSVEKVPDGIDIIITNDHTTSTGIPIPILLKYGHGTKNGGYVRPNDFITPIADSMLKDVSSSIERKLR